MATISRYQCHTCILNIIRTTPRYHRNGIEAIHVSQNHLHSCISVSSSSSFSSYPASETFTFEQLVLQVFPWCHGVVWVKGQHEVIIKLWRKSSVCELSSGRCNLSWAALQIPPRFLLYRKQNLWFKWTVWFSARFVIPWGFQSHHEPSATLIIQLSTQRWVKLYSESRTHLTLALY